MIISVGVHQKLALRVWGKFIMADFILTVLGICIAYSRDVSYMGSAKHASL